LPLLRLVRIVVALVFPVAFRVQLRNFWSAGAPLRLVDAGTTDMLPHATGSSAWQIRRMKRLPQSYVGKASIGKGIRRAIRRIIMDVWSFVPRLNGVAKTDASRWNAARSATHRGVQNVRGAKARSRFFGSTLDRITDDESRRCLKIFQALERGAEEKRTASSRGSRATRSRPLGRRAVRARGKRVRAAWWKSKFGQLAIQLNGGLAVLT
jgi:hypothetical protein